ncbi:MAG TPA: aminotransferase class I/II-fold pyridoxal phosphate-dependent enzyme [Myxococcota bacterium]|nr:aminotransferase class I/II-fold pyridoxal phosphate-dependent enzyme [Myxococcota bacterium]
MPPPASKRAESVVPFLAMEVMERAFALERAGARVIHLEIGEPEAAPPAAAQAAAARSLRDEPARYTDSRGLVELREAIAAERATRSGVTLDPERVLVTAGTSPAILLAFTYLLDPGDEVVLGTPHYACYPNLIRAVGGVPVLVPTEARDGYRLDPERVRARLTPRTRAILVASPANPTGAVQARADLEALHGLGLPLVSDEIYDGLVYDGARVTSPLELGDDAFVLDGFSKRYAMTGFRLGHLIAPASAARTLRSLAQNLFTSVASFVQRAGIAALSEGAATVAELRRTYAARRGVLMRGLQELGFEVPVTPRGAFYVFADARRFDLDSRRLASDLLERAHVAVTPGVDFGEAGEGWLRFSCTASDADLAEALERLRNALH